jgi:NTE family protein
MKAFVLSGGGNRGALQVGALRALLEHNIQPEMIIGCSAGALNAAYLAREISLVQTDQLLKMWKGTTMEDVYPGGRLSIFWRLITGQDSLFDNRNFYAFLQRTGTTPALTFGDLPTKIPIYITATHLDTEQLHVFGDDPNDRILDALMSSTALPPLHPPWTVNNQQYIDGGTVTPLPLRVAVERGATEIFALHIWDEPKPMGKLPQGVSAIINRSLGAMLRLQAQHDLLLTEMHKKRIKVHEIRLRVSNMPEMHDWSQAERLCTAGYELTTLYLDQFSHRGRTPHTTAPPPLKRLGHKLARGWLRLMTKGESAAVAETATVRIKNST